MRHLRTLLALPLLFTGALAMAEPPTPYHVKYKGTRDGAPMSIKAVRELKATGDGRFELSVELGIPFAKVAEVSEFTWSGDEIAPSTYRFKQSGLGRGRERTVEFDWQNSAAKFTSKKGRKKQEGEYAIPQGALGRLTYQVQLRRDVADAMQASETDRIFEYQVAQAGRLKLRRFRIAEEEQIETAIGPLDVVRVEEVREKDSRATLMWLAKDYQYLLVRLKRIETDGDTSELKIASATLNPGTDEEVLLVPAK